ncbi:MAG TPA: hypothetical protein VFV38_47080 [Ktedonobacteraceae bacterium]|nr:hypothetical protein [Ktedonobacteraceae bacterium]
MSFSSTNAPQKDVISVPRVWMLDVDGVLVSLLSKRAEERLIEIFAHRLMIGEPVTFNSGRSPVAIAELVLSHLEQQVADKTRLSRVMVVGEKAGAWADYLPNGTFQMAFDTTLVVPSILTSAMRGLVEDSAFIDLMEMEGGKQTMMSVIKRSGVPLDAFQQAQAKFVLLAQQRLADLGLTNAWKIDAVSDSTEIEHTSANKGKGAYRIMNWPHNQGIQSQHVIAIEDSPSGIAMAEALHRMQISVEFVFTGSQPLPSRTYAFPVIYTAQRYEQGTIEYLAQYHEAFSLPLSVRG